MIRSPQCKMQQPQNASHLFSRWIYPKRRTTTQKEILQVHQLLSNTNKTKKNNSLYTQLCHHFQL